MYSRTKTTICDSVCVHTVSYIRTYKTCCLYICRENWICAECVFQCDLCTCMCLWLIVTCGWAAWWCGGVRAVKQLSRWRGWRNGAEISLWAGKPHARSPHWEYSLSHLEWETDVEAKNNNKMNSMWEFKSNVKHVKKKVSDSLHHPHRCGWVCPEKVGGTVGYPAPKLCRCLCWSETLWPNWGDMPM